MTLVWLLLLLALLACPNRALRSATRLPASMTPRVGLRAGCSSSTGLCAWNPLNFDLQEGAGAVSWMSDSAFHLASAAPSGSIDAAFQAASDLAVKSGPTSPTIEVPLWWLESIQSLSSDATDKMVAISTAPNTLLVLGNDMLVFLFATIAIVPLFQFLNASPVIGFLAAGLCMGPAGLGLFKDLVDLESLAEAGVLFLLFEQGLELTVQRLSGLAKYAFGMGTLQVLLCTAAFFIFPFIGGVQFLEVIMGSRPDIVDITRFDEALVIGAALSLSSSAFVLKILQEKNQLSTRFGAACLGILLFQDIAVVPLLVLLPILEAKTGVPMSFSAQAGLLGVTVAKAFLGLGGILVIGGAIVRFLFSLIAQTRSSETFIALVILTALGTGKLTDSLGLSSTLGAFTAGTLLAESNYRTQIESDIKPFRGLLLGLFFLTTGASVDPYVIKEQWTTVLALLAGLIAFKTIITTALGPIFGLTKAESVRTGLILSGGGEFAFVVLTLADKLEVLPGSLAKVLVGVVVLSMAITPYLSQLGDSAADYLATIERVEIENVAENYDALHSGNSDGHEDYSNTDVVVICGYGLVGQAISDVLGSSAIGDKFKGKNEIKPVAFDLDPTVVVNGYREGKPVLYGDGSQPAVLATSGITNPKLFAVTYSDPEMCFRAVERLRVSFPSVPIYARARYTSDYLHLREAGATRIVTDENESSLRMISSLLGDLGFDPTGVANVVDSTRIDLDVLQDDLFQDFMAENSPVTLPSSSNRVNSPDAKFLNLDNLMPLLNDAKRQIEGMVGSKRDLKKDDGQSVSVNARTENPQDRFGLTSIDSDAIPGVDYCVIPPRDRGENLDRRG